MVKTNEKAWQIGEFYGICLNEYTKVTAQHCCAPTSTIFDPQSLGNYRDGVSLEARNCPQAASFSKPRERRTLTAM